MLMIGLFFEYCFLLCLYTSPLIFTRPIKEFFCDLFQGFELNGTRIAVRYPDRIPQGMGISRSALKADDLQDENVGWVLLYSTLQPTLLYRDCAIPTGCVKGDNDLKVVPHFGKYVNLLSLNEKVDTTNVCAVSHVSFFFYSPESQVTFASKGFNKYRAGVD